MYYCINWKKILYDILNDYYFSNVKEKIILATHETQISGKVIVVCVRSEGLISGSKHKTKLVLYFDLS